MIQTLRKIEEKMIGGINAELARCLNTVQKMMTVETLVFSKLRKNYGIFLKKKVHFGVVNVLIEFYNYTYLLYINSTFLSIM